ncbi:sodium:calcium antiporter, partial [candidate division WOR-3 bacterium]|nr:sodium:calcium antiporter [candidate division WOR-3 bacterium]
LLLLLRDDWFFKGIPSLSRIDGAILLGFFSLFLFYLYRMALSDRKKLLIEKNISHIEYSKRELLKASLITIIGITGIILGGHLVVNNAIIIARSLGVSETLISVTIVALGTSLPEMVTSLMAVKKNKWDIAIGNVVGSNIFNILFVLGLSSIIRPIQFSTIAFPDLLIVIGISIILLPFIHTRHRLSRKEGGVLLLIYIAYIVFAVLRR